MRSPGWQVGRISAGRGLLWISQSGHCAGPFSCGVFIRREGNSANLTRDIRTVTDRTPLTDSRGINNWPSYSPDGRTIVFGSSREGNFEIYRMNADGSDPRRLTDSPLQDIRPRFSPDAERIAFTSHRDGNAEIYIMNADGSIPRRVTDSSEHNDYAEWHPGGEHSAGDRQRTAGEARPVSGERFTLIAWQRLGCADNYFFVNCRLAALVRWHFAVVGPINTCGAA